MEKALQVYGSSLLIQLAVALKNTAEQYPEFTLKELGGLPAKGLFALGWTLFALSISSSGLQRLVAFVGSILVVSSVFYMKTKMKKGLTPNPLIVALFPIGWIIVTYALMMKQGSLNKIAPLGTLLVLLSMMVVLPWQRKHNIVDFLGYNMFAVAWVIFSLVRLQQG